MSSEDTLEKALDYINAEVQLSLKDYQFIVKLNKTATESFRDYMSVADKIAKNVHKINENHEARTRLDNLVKEIDRIDAKVNSLEELAYKVDSYSKRLEETYSSMSQ